MLETTDLFISAEEVVKRYKELAEIERGWRSLKSTQLLRPVYHWTERRIRGHVFVCVLALQVERWMRNKAGHFHFTEANGTFDSLEVTTPITEAWNRT